MRRIPYVAILPSTADVAMKIKVLRSIPACWMPCRSNLAYFHKGCAFNHDLQKFSPALQADRLAALETSRFGQSVEGGADSGLHEVQQWQ